MGFGIWDLGFGVWVLGYGVWGLEIRVWGFAIQILGRSCRLPLRGPARSFRFNLAQCIYQLVLES